MKFFESKLCAIQLEDEIKTYILRTKNGYVLSIVQIGENKVSEKYISLKQAFCRSIGVEVEVHKISESLEDGKVFDSVKTVFNKHISGGILVQLPLPRKSLNPILDLIPVGKDVDLLSGTSRARFYSGDFEKLPPVIRSLALFIGKTNLNLKNTEVTVIGNGFLVGKPAAFYLKQLGACVEIINKYKVGRSINADLLVLSAGVPNLINGEDIKKGCNVVDFGSSVVGGRVVGDLNLESRIGDLGVVSPSPGGVGPLVVRFLVMNHLGI